MSMRLDSFIHVVFWTVFQWVSLHFRCHLVLSSVYFSRIFFKIWTRHNFQEYTHTQKKIYCLLTMYMTWFTLFLCKSPAIVCTHNLSHYISDLMAVILDRSKSGPEYLLALNSCFPGFVLRVCRLLHSAVVMRLSLFNLLCDCSSQAVNTSTSVLISQLVY